ncbi:hypothetical protein TRVA0_023S01860 [Trichomonascus vanleenenianus]|uniref:uncharacterized protein n=1 Tax=Trichomonascus vanleenenianus TaxID=2268995 RepID=UPI003ECA883A
MESHSPQAPALKHKVDKSEAAEGSIEPLYSPFGASEEQFVFQPQSASTPAKKPDLMMEMRRNMDPAPLTPGQNGGNANANNLFAAGNASGTPSEMGMDSADSKGLLHGGAGRKTTAKGVRDVEFWREYLRYLEMLLKEERTTTRSLCRKTLFTDTIKYMLHSEEVSPSMKKNITDYVNYNNVVNKYNAQLKAARQVVADHTGYGRTFVTRDQQKILDIENLFLELDLGKRPERDDEKIPYRERRSFAEMEHNGTPTNPGMEDMFSHMQPDMESASRKRQRVDLQENVKKIVGLLDTMVAKQDHTMSTLNSMVNTTQYQGVHELLSKVTEVAEHCRTINTRLELMESKMLNGLDRIEQKVMNLHIQHHEHDDQQ